jgi:hypothetical protein
MSNPATVERTYRDRLETAAKLGPIGISESNLRALSNLADLAEQHGFDVFIANGPVYQALHTNPAYRQFASVIREKLTETTGMSERLKYILREPLAYSKDEMVSVDHVVHSAAKDFTKEAVSGIKRSGID